MDSANSQTNYNASAPRRGGIQTIINPSAGDSPSQIVQSPTPSMIYGQNAQILEYSEEDEFKALFQWFKIAAAKFLGCQSMNFSDLVLGDSCLEFMNKYIMPLYIEKYSCTDKHTKSAERNWDMFYQKTIILMDQCEKQLEEAASANDGQEIQAPIPRRPFNSPDGLAQKMLAKSPVNLTITEKKSLHIFQILGDKAPFVEELSRTVKSGDQYAISPLISKALEILLFLIIKQSNCEKARQIFESTIENGLSDENQAILANCLQKMGKPQACCTTFSQYFQS